MKKRLFFKPAQFNFKLQKYINKVKIKNFFAYNYYIIGIFNTFVNEFRVQYC